MLEFNSIMLGSHQPKVLAEFWEKVLDKKPDMAEEGWWGFSIGSCMLSIGEHSEVHDKSHEPQRIILNFDAKDVKEEFERIKTAGAEVIKEPYQMEGWDGWIATLADPDGNYFQLMTPWQK